MRKIVILFQLSPRLTPHGSRLTPINPPISPSVPKISYPCNNQHKSFTLYKSNSLALTASIPTVDDLIIRVIDGDSRASRQLYDRYSRAMYNTALRITGNRADAEDVLQEAFCAAFTQIQRFAQKSTFGAWLRQIVVHKCVGLLKSKKLIFSELDEKVSDQAEESEMDEFEVQYTVELIKQAMYSLPDGYRTVLSLHLLEGYDYDEIAEILTVSPSTIRTQYMRGKQKLLISLKENTMP